MTPAEIEQHAQRVRDAIFGLTDDEAREVFARTLEIKAEDMFREASEGPIATDELSTGSSLRA